ncbi:UBX domain-containing protein [Lachnellula subtilissima]|uniref:UBX domain-containing protein n=1 Tax=Lachnellula subtilissima TaxID=602034 RepID=A0A8H8RZB2_9HELO|nr:UBX domain-containing protein [Lachnellula subtilissima]
MAENTSHNELITEFCGVTSASATDAQQYLEANRWDLSGAVAEYFTAHEEGIAGAQEGGEEDPQEAEAYTGPRTLDGRPAPASIPTVGSSSRAAAPPKRGGVATLGSIGQSSGGGGHGHAHDDDDDSDDEDFKPSEQPRDLFAGGEKSGLAVQDPNNRNDPRKVVNDILKKARTNSQRPGNGEPSSSAPTSRFRGSGQTLGGDDTPSQTIPDPQPRARDPGPVQTRVLHLWEDGFSIEDGELRRFDDPQNAAELQMIRQGRAPVHLMGVATEQPVDVQLIKHEENYKPQPKVYKPFSGGGQRLGSPTPGASSSTTMTSTPAPAAAASTSSSVPEPEIDTSVPAVSLRIQLANGSRLPARFNTTQTIGDVYEFISRATSDSNARPWVLATTFPSKDHTDKSLALGDVAEFKRGGTAVQKWT